MPRRRAVLVAVAVNAALSGSFGALAGQGLWRKAARFEKAWRAFNGVALAGDWQGIRA